MIIGSTAIRKWYPDFKREPADLDIVVDTPRQNTPGIEYLYNPILLEQYRDEYLSPVGLLTLKASHIFWDIKWAKHIYDIGFLVGKGNRIDRQLFYRLYPFWQEKHGKSRRSDLKMSAEDFFNNALPDGHLHDDLHRLLADIPAYTLILEDGKEVEVSEEKFNNLSHEDKCRVVTEEIMVMATERYREMGFQHGYSRMLKKFIISHAPLWEAIFILENYRELSRPTYDYMTHIDQRKQELWIQ